MADEVDDWIRELWAEVRPAAEEKVDRVAGALRLARTGALDEATREDAAAVAHQLAGSLGTYGFDDAAGAASDAERLLATANIDVEALAAAVGRLEAVLDHGR